MRESKFRGFKNDKMDYNPELPYSAHVDLNEQITDMKNLMQYIGLKDVNNKEIYEGDIISLKIFAYDEEHQLEEIDGLWLIKWDPDGCYALKHTKRDIKSVHIPCVIYTLKAEAKIVGNIFENPELLKGKMEK